MGSDSDDAVEPADMEDPPKVSKIKSSTFSPPFSKAGGAKKVNTIQKSTREETKKEVNPSTSSPVVPSFSLRNFNPTPVKST